MKLIEHLMLLSCLLSTCKAFETRYGACIKVKEALGSATHCEESEDLLVFFQSSHYLGNVVKFSKKSERKLRIECLNSRIQIDLEKIPRLNFEKVNKIELHECSVINETLLTTIKTQFNIKIVKFLSITATNEPNKNVMTEKFFENVSELEELEMNINFRINLTARTFDPLKTLKLLKLQVHDVIALPSDVFVPLENVRNLVVSNSGLAKHETKKLNITLNKCINMKSFALIGIRWPIVIETGLVNFVGPLKVTIQNNRIESEMSSKTFEKASHIEEIRLINNSITSLPNDFFASQTSMMTVDLSFNLISEIHRDIFRTTTSLEFINLSHNKIKTVERKVFSNLRYLTRLNLAHNQITQINFASNFGVLRSLQNLDLSSNKIEKLFESLSFTNLSMLELNHNKLKRFFVEQFFGISQQNLTINLKHQSSENLQKSSLESIDFRDLVFPKNSSTVKSLLINVDDEIICNCHTLSLYNFTLKRLKLDPEIYKMIKIFPGIIKCIQKSSETPEKVSDITDSITCPLDFPHQIFCPAFCTCDRRPYDGYLIVRCSNISAVPLLPYFKILKDIRLDRIELNVAGNRINHLPSKIRDVNYNDVTKIHASHNSIQSITTQNIPERLEFLDLKQNRLSRIHADVIEKFTKLHFLHLSDNPWNCAEAKDLVRFVKRYRDIEKDFNMVQCSSYKYFLEIETEDQCSGEILKTALVFLGVASIVATIIFYCIRRETITEWIFLKDKNHLIEKTFDKIKLFDGIICVAEQDKIFGKYIAAKLIERPNHLKIGMILKTWAENDPIPKNVLKGFQNSRRVIVVLSEYFEECDWTRWSFFNTNTRIIFVVKGKRNTESVGISNMFTIKFGDPWFWEKLKHAMTHRKELVFDDDHAVEMQPLQCVV